MNTTQPIATKTPIDPNLMAAVREWSPRPSNPGRPELTVEPHPEGQRVKMTYLGVETGVMFSWNAPVAAHSVRATLDRLFEVLSWRVTEPPASKTA